MPESCCVVGCTSRRNSKAKCSGIGFFRIPVERHRRALWVFAISRKNWTPKNWERVCGRHFVSGKPSDSPDDIDYKPSKFMRGLSLSPKKPTSSLVTARAMRSNKRTAVCHMQEVAEAFEEANVLQNQAELAALNQSVIFHDYIPCSNLACNAASDQFSEPCVFTDSGTQTDMSMSDLSNLENQLKALEASSKTRTWSIDKIKDNDKATKFYTGLPTFAVFMWLFNLLRPKAERMTYWGSNKCTATIKKRRMSMATIDQLLFVLMRLKVGLMLYDLADRFNVSTAFLSRVFTTWIYLLEKELEPLNPCPTRQIVAETLPAQFLKFANIRFIIDCTELFIERASCFTAQNLTFSSYKHHTTAKFFVSITPTGEINFVSNSWGGKVSDRYITEHCGFLDLVDAGDLIMADKGFNIGDLLARKQAFLNIPPFLYNKQFTEEEITATRKIAKVRIHVERSIGRVKQFHILDPVIPLSLKNVIGPIFRVCCYLSNLDKPLVK